MAHLTDPFARLRNPSLKRALIQILGFRPIPLNSTYLPACELPRIVGFRQLERGNTAALRMFKNATCPDDVTGLQKRVYSRQHTALVCWQ